MKCVILAAGRGLRLHRSDSKPLTSILGLPLIERTIRTAQEGGASEFVVVTGYRSEPLGDFVSNLGQRLDIKITLVENPAWQETGNGASLLAAKDHLDAPFLLSMSDHLFDASTVQGLLQSPVPEGGVLLATDRRLYNPLVDLDDVTRVKVDSQDQRLLSIGKNLTDHNGFDTGLFLCDPALIQALEKASDEGDSSLTGGIQKLIEDNRAYALDIGNAFWIDVDDEPAFQRAEEALLRRIRDKDRDGPVSRYLNRPLSARLSKRLAYTDLTPNQISLLAFGLSVIGAGLILIPYYWSLALGGLLAQAASILDGCDGEIARLKKQQSAYGAWFDAVLDRYSDALLLSALALHSWQTGAVSAIPIGFVAVMGALILSYTADKYDGFMQRRGGSQFRLGRDLRMLLVALGALLNQPLVTLGIIAVIMNAEVVRRILVCRDQEN